MGQDFSQRLNGLFSIAEMGAIFFQGGVHFGLAQNEPKTQEELKLLCADVKRRR